MTYQKPEILQTRAAISAVQASLSKVQGHSDNPLDPNSMSIEAYGSDE